VALRAPPAWTSGSPPTAVSCGSPSATTATAAPTPARGTGLVGLIDRVEALGGQLTLRSLPGAGTTLNVALPLAAPTPMTPPVRPD
jgi:hypothetical protein